MLTRSTVRAKSLHPTLVRTQGEDVKVRSYGKLADLLGHERDIRIGAPCTIAEFRAQLAGECPEAAEALASKRVLACVGDIMVPDDHILEPGETIELLAPVSGG
jgi:molybdopterin converting factor small subunit